MIPTDPAALKRLESAWNDPEVARKDLLKRFKLSSSDLTTLAARLKNPRWDRANRQGNKDVRSEK